MLLIIFITFESTSLGKRGLAPRGRFGSCSGSSSLLPFSLLYDFTMLLTVDSGTPNFAAVGRKPLTIAHLAMSARLSPS